MGNVSPAFSTNSMVARIEKWSLALIALTLTTAC